MSAVNIPESLIERVKIATGKTGRVAAVRAALEEVAERAPAANKPNAATIRALRAKPSKEDVVLHTREEFSAWLKTIPERKKP